jgi:hypothetical protein
MALTGGVLTATCLSTMPGSSGAASTEALPAYLADFAHCPVDNPAVTSCLYASTGGRFRVGDTTLVLPSPAKLNLGLAQDSTGAVTAVAPTDGTEVLAVPTTQVPILGGLMTIGATPVLSALPTLSVTNLLVGKGVSITLPLVVGLSNALLGSTCTLGDSTTPLVVNLTDGRTKPPAPHRPVEGSKGTLKSTSTGVVTIKGVRLVDNAYAAPGAYGCGLLGVLDPLVDSLEGLPSAAGTNSAKLEGTVKTAPASLIRKFIG